jgi:phage-related minor tail protein
MAEEQAAVSVRIEADTRPFAEALGELERLSDAFGSQLTGALRDAVVGGRSLDDVLRRVGMNLASMALGEGLRPLSGMFSQFVGSLLGGLGGALPFAKGASKPFAAGGALAAPSYFPALSSGGLHAAAARTAMGVASAASAAAGSTTNLVFNVTTPDAPSFRKSEAQITGMLARAVSRGARTI